jgi:hypothetical protein
VEGDIVPPVDVVYSLGSTGQRWESLYVGTGSIYIGDTKLSSEGNTLIIHGDILPMNDDSVTIGSNSKRIKSLHVGPGTIFIGPTGTLGNDPNGIIYAEQGFAAPTIVLGATIPGSTGPVGGGVRMSVTGPTGPIQYQHLDASGGPTGPVYTITQNVPGSDAVVPSGYTGTLVGATGEVVLGNGLGNATLIAETSITTHTRSRLWCMASVEFTITTNSVHAASFYLEVNGETSNTTTRSWSNGNNNTQMAFSINHRTALENPGTYGAKLYGYGNAANVAKANHCDIFVMGNLI